jgi:hypothetical protein
MAVSPTTEPDDRSMPPVMMTCVTPTEMMPITETCRIMIFRRCTLSRKLWPTKIQPRISQTSAMPISTRKMPSSGGTRRRLGRVTDGAVASATLLTMVQSSFATDGPVIAPPAPSP